LIGVFKKSRSRIHADGRGGKAYQHLDPDGGGGFVSITAARQFQKQNGVYVAVSGSKRLWM
jgi:hypothetical protein